jgi:hypothetical protein
MLFVLDNQSLAENKIYLTLIITNCSHKMEDAKMPKELKKMEYTMGDDELV